MKDRRPTSKTCRFNFSSFGKPADAALYRAKSGGRDQVQMISTTRGLSAISGTEDALLQDLGVTNNGTIGSGETLDGAFTSSSVGVIATGNVAVLGPTQTDIGGLKAGVSRGEFG